MVEEPEEEMDYRYLERLVRTTGIKVTKQLVAKAMREFKSIVPSKTGLDINQFDVVMKKIGFASPFDRHRLFRAFDFDFNSTVEYCEFIWGIAMLYDGSLAQRYDAIWKMLDVDSSDSLHEDQLFLMIQEGGSLKDSEVIRYMCERVFQRLDKDLSGSLDYEEFQLGLLEDKVVADIFDKATSGKISKEDVLNLATDVKGNRLKR